MSEAREQATGLLLAEIPCSEGWLELREAIQNGSIDFHSDPMSWTISGALRALSTQAARIAELEEALRPFAIAAEDLGTESRDDDDIWESAAAMSIDARDLRRAASALSRSGEW